MPSPRRFVAILNTLIVCLIAGCTNALAQSCAGNLNVAQFQCAPAVAFAAPSGLDPPSSASEMANDGGSYGAGAQVDETAASHQQPFTRVGIGANVSPLGIGINGTTVLTEYFDARLMGNFFSFTSPQFEVDGFRGAAQLRLASMAASIDWYPLNSIWRLSPGLMFYNGNRISVAALVEPGTSFTINGQTFYSASSNAATGATPVTGSGVLGLHPRPIAFTVAGGFGKFVPRSNRHWSFPSEFGVVFMGGPTANLTPKGWVCLDQAQTQCSNIGDPANPITQQFNSALQAQLTKWRRDLGKFDVYPMFSYSVVYSFNIR